MEDFLKEFKRVLQKWPEQARWSCAQLADYTQTDIDDVLQWMSFGLKKNLERHSALTWEDGEAAYDLLASTHASGGRITADTYGAEAENISRTFAEFKQSLQPHIVQKDWRRVYKNLTMFFVAQKASLPFDLHLECFGDLLRYGGKAATPVAELVVFFRDGVSLCLTGNSRESFEEALDFIDAYGDLFVGTDAEGILAGILDELAMPAETYDLTDRIKDVRLEIGLT